MVSIRPERASDHAAVHTVVSAAFGQPAEADLVAALRAVPRVISLVALDGEALVGHIMFSPLTVEGAGLELMALGLAPLAVAPARQRQGIGSALTFAGLDACRKAGADLVVVLGHPDYYPRFGFAPAHTLGLRCEYDAPPEAFMAQRLRPDAPLGAGGLVRYHPAFAAV